MTLKALEKGAFQLYDLKVIVVVPDGTPDVTPSTLLPCNAYLNDSFELRGELLFLPPGQGMSIYSIGSVLPLLAAKQRVTQPNDWMSYDADVACPDPLCPSRLRIKRTAIRTFYPDGSQEVEQLQSDVESQGQGEVVDVRK
ncbi:hypothetical protein DL93DRAFT_2053554 [Clavulina sp. PMI_390]|nr:hypothetical protein DL93DRAFT_2053554 [Clavulina sp. PMI_390]